MVHSSDIIIALIAILFPPAAVAILTGCSCDLLINILLTMLVSAQDIIRADMYRACFRMFNSLLD